MGVYPISDVIQKSRIFSNMTQEELSEGICSVETLSRIENGKQAPSRIILNELMKRLGKSGVRFIPILPTNNLNVQALNAQNLKREISKAIAYERYAKAEHLFRQLSFLIQEKDNRGYQYLIRTKAVIDYHTGKLSIENYISKLYFALQLTIPNISSDNIPHLPLIRSEVTIFLNIANAYGQLKDYTTAIYLLQQLDTFYKETRMDYYEKNYGRILILTNLSIWLSRINNLEETIKVCDQGIRLSLKTDCGNFLDRLLYNKALAIQEITTERLNSENTTNVETSIKKLNLRQKKTCLQMLQQAYYISLQLNHVVIQTHIQKYIYENIL